MKPHYARSGTPCKRHRFNACPFPIAKPAVDANNLLQYQHCRIHYPLRRPMDDRGAGVFSYGTLPRSGQL